jgi:hypothetical protein
MDPCLSLMSLLGRFAAVVHNFKLCFLLIVCEFLSPVLNGGGDYGEFIVNSAHSKPSEVASFSHISSSLLVPIDGTFFLLWVSLNFCFTAHAAVYSRFSVAESTCSDWSVEVLLPSSF